MFYRDKSAAVYGLFLFFIYRVNRGSRHRTTNWQFPALSTINFSPHFRHLIDEHTPTPRLAKKKTIFSNGIWWTRQYNILYNSHSRPTIRYRDGAYFFILSLFPFAFQQKHYAKSNYRNSVIHTPTPWNYPKRIVPRNCKPYITYISYTLPHAIT